MIVPPIIYTIQPSGNYSVLNDSNTKQIRSFKNLVPGWDLGSGEPISNQIVTKALKLYHLSSPYSLPLEIYPTPDGGISLTFYKKDDFLETIINPDQSFDLIREKGIGRKFKTLYHKKSADFNAFFHGLNSIKCASSGYSSSTPLISVKSEDASLGMRSKIHQTTVEYRWSTMSAQNNSVSVSTLQNITLAT